MRFLLRWLRIERPPGVALHPIRIVQLQAGPEQAYGRCAAIVEQTLGGHITAHDAPSLLEASFGLVNSERISLSIEARADGGSTVRLQSRRLAGAQQTQESAYLSRFERELAADGRYEADEIRSNPQ